MLTYIVVSLAYSGMHSLIELLAATPLLLLFLVIGLGYLIGSIRVAGFSLGPSAVLFTGIALGSLDSRLRLPDIIYLLGLILFVYTISLQSGSTFFSSFNKRGIQTNLFALAMMSLGALLTVVASRAFGMDGATLVGVYCGSLTNTPALAASIETLRGLFKTGNLPLESVSAPVIGYGVSYPFGVIGVLLGFYFFSRLRSGSVDSGNDGSQENQLIARTFRVTNEKIVGENIRDVLVNSSASGVVLSRMKRGDFTSLVYSDTRLDLNDLVVAVGPKAGLDAALAIFGEVAREQIHLDKDELDYRRIVVSERKVVGRKLKDLRLPEMLDATVTRIRRGDVDFVPTGDTVLEYGDRVRVLTWVGNIERVSRFFGDSVKVSSEADFFSVSLGIVLGVLLGLIPVPLPGGATFHLGFAGGPLFVGLILGRLQRTGSIVWGMPFSANLALRQIGLVLFLAGVGTKAGDGFVSTMMQGGAFYALVGSVITVTVTVATLSLGGVLFKLPLPALMGFMSGIQTQPACLAYANERTSTEAANTWYASVFPTAMIGKILLAQLLVKLLV